MYQIVQESWPILLDKRCRFCSYWKEVGRVYFYQLRIFYDYRQVPCQYLLTHFVLMRKKIIGYILSHHVDTE